MYHIYWSFSFRKRNIGRNILKLLSFAALRNSLLNGTKLGIEKLFLVSNVSQLKIKEVTKKCKHKVLNYRKKC